MGCVQFQDGSHIAGDPGEASLHADNPGSEGGVARLLLDILLDILLYMGTLMVIFMRSLLDNLRALQVGLYDNLQLITSLHDGCHVRNNIRRVVKKSGGEKH